MTNHVFTSDIGRLYISIYRNLLQELSFKGYEISWIEGSGWLSKQFHIKCDDQAYDYIQQWVSMMQHD